MRESTGAIARPLRYWAVALSWAASACAPELSSPIERAEFGVVFGGQYQERSEIPFELDSAKQTLGFVVRLKQTSDAPLPVHWELAKPGPTSNGLASPLSRRTELFDAVLPASQLDFRQQVTFNPGDQLGTWNIRVLVGPNVAIDRPFWVFDAARRRSRTPTDAGLE